MNGVYIREMEDEKFTNKIYEFLDKKYPKDLIEKTIPLIKERVKSFLTIYHFANSFFSLIQPTRLYWKERKIFWKSL